MNNNKESVMENACENNRFYTVRSLVIAALVLNVDTTGLYKATKTRKRKIIID